MFQSNAGLMEFKEKERTFVQIVVYIVLQIQIIIYNALILQK